MELSTGGTVITKDCSRYLEIFKEIQFHSNEKCKTWLVIRLCSVKSSLME
jgi:hypothetical protein